VGIRSFHEFDATISGKIECRSVSNSTNSTTFRCKYGSSVSSPIKRVLDFQDFNKGAFLIVQKDDIFFLAQINAADLQRNELNISIFLPSLPAKKFSISKSPSIVICTTDVIGRLFHSSTKSSVKTIILSNEQFNSIQDLCDEF